MNGAEAIKIDFEFYSELDEESELYCVFGSDSGFAYASYASEEEAERDANTRNERVEDQLVANSNRVQALASLYFR